MFDRTYEQLTSCVAVALSSLRTYFSQVEDTLDIELRTLPVLYQPLHSYRVLYPLVSTSSSDAIHEQPEGKLDIDPRRERRFSRYDINF